MEQSVELGAFGPNFLLWRLLRVLGADRLGVSLHFFCFKVSTQFAQGESVFLKDRR